MKNFLKITFSVAMIFLLFGCSKQQSETFINHYSEVILTQNNELQFRFLLNEEGFEKNLMYKLRIMIHNQKLASAIGRNEVIYGERSVFNGEYLEVNKNKGNLIIMEPIPLKKDLHTFELEKLIVNDHAITVEIYNDDQILAKAPLTNFFSRL
ncbi:hypothetical protein ACE38V_02700 [Cytobacillus sp. Hz8]|uniref:hypothetical protein n=1 Tax=Cytobacillus sp. Hz8 TaxID=3347168 RepID=UPI0035E3140A